MTLTSKTAPDAQRPRMMGALARALAVQPLRMGLALTQTQRLIRRADARRDHSRVFTGDVGSVSPLAVNQFNETVVQRFSNEAMLRKYALREDAGNDRDKADGPDLAQAMPLAAMRLATTLLPTEDIEDTEDIKDKRRGR